MTAGGARRRTAAAAAVLAAATVPAAAHGAGQGFVLTLPTHLAIAAGAVAVAASFVAVLLVPDRRTRALFAWRLPIVRWRTPPAVPVSGAVFVLVAALIAAGWLGIRDPLSNPLPLAVWTVWWVGLPLASAAFGDLAAVLNPFVGPYRLADRITGGALAAAARPLPPAVAAIAPGALFFAFAWFELVYPAPEDPERLASVVAVYVLVTFALMATFGEAWLERADPFRVVFGLVGRVAPLLVEVDAAGGRRLALACPGAGLIGKPPLAGPAVLLLLLTLSTVSFDGLSRTFLWLGAFGINPLEFPGRTALLGLNSAGLLAAFAALAAAFLAAAALGRRIGGGGRGFTGRLVLSLVPISVAFHGAHYLTVLLVDGQYAVAAAGDPFGLGWNLFGLRGDEVTTSFLSTRSGSIAVWSAEAALIVAGHLLAVAIAHGLIVAGGTADRPAAAEAPLAGLMVAYTAFGLWLLSTPVVG